MKESDTYQMILEEGIERGREEGLERGIERGELEGARKALLLTGSIRLGEPEPRVRERSQRETNVAQVEEWLRPAMQVESWTDLSGFSH